MSTLTLKNIRDLVRSGLNEPSTTAITDTELNSIINDGYINVAVKGLCYEDKIAVTSIPSSIDIISLLSYNIVRVNYVEYNLGTSALGMTCVLPQAIGHIPLDGNSPQYWFQWGYYLKIEPMPATATYSLNLFASCYPTTAMLADDDTPSLIPSEFHECVYLYAMTFSCFKLRRWEDAIMNYNRFTESVQIKRLEYVSKFAEVRAVQDVPKTVTVRKK